MYVLEEAGARLATLPRALGRDVYLIRSAGRLEKPERYWVWYEPAWYLPLDVLDTTPAYVVLYDNAGRELTPRQEVPPRTGYAHDMLPHVPFVHPSPARAWFGPVTGPAEAAKLLGTAKYFINEVRSEGGGTMYLPLQVTLVTAQHFVPGVRWSASEHPGMVTTYTVLMLASALASGLGCYVLARRYAFSRVRRALWLSAGLVFGPLGLLLMFALQEWPARIPCSKCHHRRVVTRDTCEHCGARRDLPAPDGTEIFKEAREAEVGLAIARH